MKKKYFYILLISVLIMGFVLLLNYLQPLRGDDLGRANTDVLANGLIYMFHSIEIDYMSWTGRVSAQALIYVLMSKKYITLSLFIVNSLNTIAFYIFILCSFKIATSDRGKILSKDFLLFIFFFTFVFYQTGFIANVLWKTGAIQYFWGIALLTFFYYNTVIKKKNSIALGLLVGLIIGLYNEIYVCISILLCLAYFLEKKIYKEDINIAILAYFVSCLIGGAILILAPGNYARLEYLSSGVHTTILDNITNLIYQIIFTPEYTFILLVMIIGFLGLIFTNSEVKKTKAIIYSMALIVSVFVLVPVARAYSLNQRVLLVYYAIFFILFVQQIYQHKSRIIKDLYLQFKKVSWIFVILLLIQLYLMLSMYMSLYEFEQDRGYLIAYNHAIDETNPSLPCLSRYIGPTVFVDDITLDKNAYNNKVFAEFYGFDSIYCK